VKLEQFDIELLLDLLHGVGDRRLALVQRRRCPCVAAGIHDSHECAPLLERNSRVQRLHYQIIR